MAKKIVKLTKPVLIEGQIFKKGTRLLIESEEIQQGVPVDTAPDPEVAEQYATLRRARRLRRMAGEGEEDTTLTEEEIDDQIEALRRIKRVRRMAEPTKPEDVQAVRRAHRLHRMGDTTEGETSTGDDKATSPDAMRRLRRGRALRRLDLAGSDGTENFEGEIANADGDITNTSSVGVDTMRRMHRS